MEGHRKSQGGKGLKGRFFRRVGNKIKIPFCERGMASLFLITLRMNLLFPLCLQRNLLEVILNNPVASAPSLISQSVGDQFELCLVKCRTSSKVHLSQHLEKMAV